MLWKEKNEKKIVEYLGKIAILKDFLHFLGF